MDNPPAYLLNDEEELTYVSLAEREQNLRYAGKLDVTCKNKLYLFWQKGGSLPNTVEQFKYSTEKKVMSKIKFTESKSKQYFIEILHFKILTYKIVI